jgi:hypothetical protein
MRLNITQSNYLLLLGLSSNSSPANFSGGKIRWGFVLSQNNRTIYMLVKEPLHGRQHSHWMLRSSHAALEGAFSFGWVGSNLTIDNHSQNSCQIF